MADQASERRGYRLHQARELLRPLADRSGRRTNRSWGGPGDLEPPPVSTRAQAEKRLRAIIDEVEAVTPWRTYRRRSAAGAWFCSHSSKRRGCSKRTVETVDSQFLRVHIVPFFRVIRRWIASARTTRRGSWCGYGALGRKLRKRSGTSSGTLHSLFEFAVPPPLGGGRIRASRSTYRRSARSADIRFLGDIRSSSPGARAWNTYGRGAGAAGPRALSHCRDDRASSGRAARSALARSGPSMRSSSECVRRSCVESSSRRSLARGVPWCPDGGRASEEALRGTAGGRNAFLRRTTTWSLRHPETGEAAGTARIVDGGSSARAGRAGVRPVRFHDLRHTFGTRVAASGEVSLRTLQEWMGHRDAKTTLIYADYQPAEHESEIVSRAFGAEPGISSRRGSLTRRSGRFAVAPPSPAVLVPARPMESGRRSPRTERRAHQGGRGWLSELRARQ